jgi:O-antigen/teichoic acid export membrane protein
MTPPPWRGDAAAPVEEPPAPPPEPITAPDGTDVAEGPDGTDGAAWRPGDLGHAVVTGVRWALVDQVVQQVGRIAINVMLTRLAAPEDFGLIGIAFVFTALASFVTDAGLGAALMHERRITPAHIRTATTVTLLTGAVLASVTVLLARPVAGLFDEPRLAPVLMVLAINFPLRGLVSIPRDLLRRAMVFRPAMIGSGLAVLGSGVAAVTVGFLGGGVWALVTYSVAESVLLVVATVVFAVRERVYTLALGIDRAAFRDMYRFGLSQSAFLLLYYGQINGDNLLVGKVLGPEALGYYNLAYRMMLYPIEKVGEVIGRVTVPAFNAIQHDLVRLRSSYLRVLQNVTLVCAPASIGLSVTAPLVVPIVFGAPWVPAVPALQILALNGPRLAANRLNGSVFQSRGVPHWDLGLNVVSIGVYLTAFVVGVRHGVAGMAWAYTFAGYALLPANQQLVARALHTRLRDAAGALTPLLAATALMAGAAEATRRAVEHRGPPVAQLAATALAGAAVYFAVMHVLAPDIVRRAATDLLRRRPALAPRPVPETSEA